MLATSAGYFFIFKFFNMQLILLLKNIEEVNSKQEKSLVEQIVKKTMPTARLESRYQGAFKDFTIFSPIDNGVALTIHCEPTTGNKLGIRIVAQALATLYQCDVYCNHSVAYLRGKQSLKYRIDNLNPIYNITYGPKLKDIGSRKEE